MPELTEKELEFVRGLTELTRKTGIEIAGCGCCGSPFLFKVDSVSDESGYYFAYDDGKLEWLNEPGDNSSKFEKCEWEENKDNIIK